MFDSLVIQAANWPEAHVGMSIDNPTLQVQADSSLLPMVISPTGADDEPITEVLLCDSISGGADYNDGMPHSLSLIRIEADGTEHRMRYEQHPLLDGDIPTEVDDG